MTGSWLNGPRAALPQGVDGTEQHYRGERLGLPEDGRGSVAGTGRRVLAIAVDWLLAALVASLFLSSAVSTSTGLWRLATWAAISVVAVAIFSTTPGQLVVGIGVARVDAEVPVGVVRAVARVALIALVVPVVVWDVDGRGLQDRLTQTVVIRSR